MVQLWIQWVMTWVVSDRVVSVKCGGYCVVRPQLLSWRAVDGGRDDTLDHDERVSLIRSRKQAFGKVTVFHKNSASNLSQRNSSDVLLRWVLRVL